MWKLQQYSSEAVYVHCTNDYNFGTFRMGTYVYGKIWYPDDNSNYFG